jgi:hypothetical protein
MNNAIPIEVVRRAVEDGHQQEPKWSDPEACGLFSLEEAIAYPEEPPILRLFQLDNEFEIMGEIWLRPADLPELIRDLQIFLEDYALRPPCSRRRASDVLLRSRPRPATASAVSVSP